MGLLREVWTAIRDTSFVVAQVVTLGVIAIVVGLIALNALFVRSPILDPSAPTGPSRPLTALVPTLVPDTPTPIPTPVPPTATSVPARSDSLVDAVATAAAQRPGWIPPTGAGQPSPTAAAPSATPQPTRPAEPTPAPPTATPAAADSPVATATPAATGQMLKILPAADGLPARLRAEPTTKAPILVRVPLGARVELLGTTTGDELQPGNPKWVRVKWKDQTGYIYSTLVGDG